MGLEGISINQLRITPEYNSAELNGRIAQSSETVKIVDGLSDGQRVDPDKKKEHDKNRGFDSSKKNNEESIEQEDEPIEKYDLSDSNKYVISIDEKSDQIVIVEKASGNIIQNIDANELSQLVAFSVNSCGSIVNRRF